MKTDPLRRALVELLTAENAHASAQKAVSNVARENRCRRPAAGSHSPWELLEHMRLAQEDILRYTLDREWVSPEWPVGYWPAPTDDVDDLLWESAVDHFLSDLRDVVALVQDESRDLSAELPHGEGRTYLRQVLLVADHNAYHAGQLVEVRKQLGDWSPK
jgi:uncharacterized damage-inducible protein DinB